jgi:hypothetical protein
MRSTSLKAYREIEASGLLSTMRWRVYRELFAHGPMTGQELDEALAHEGRGHYHKRLPELLERGVVATVGERPCRVTGHKAIIWDVTANLPVESRTPITDKLSKLYDRRAKINAEIERLQFLRAAERSSKEEEQR